MKNLWILGASLLVVFALVGCGSEQPKSEAQQQSQTEQVSASGDVIAQTVCPVMGEKINRDVYTDYDGKRIYFCCQSCVDEFKKDPDKYMKKMMDEGVALENAPEGGGR